ncbi:MAG: hypothetical protein IKQ79_06790 [Bacteroidales bacterium]|nr:hypothetical protein [Bacteroidales bacterium]
MTKKRFTLFAIVMAAFVLLVGCKKEKELSTLRPKQQMLKFESFEEIFRYLNDNTRSFDTGFTSYGSFMDSIYYSLNIENRFKTIEEITKFVNENDSLFQLKLCDDGYYMFETILFDHPFRNVANKDGIFQVRDSVYKIIQDGLISTSADNIESLYTDNVYSIDNNELFRIHKFETKQTSINECKSYMCGCTILYGLPKENESINGNNKTYVKLTFYYNQNYTTLDLGATFFAKPYKRTGFWFGCFRTIYVEFDANIHYYSYNWDQCYHRLPCDGVTYVSTSGASTTRSIYQTIYSDPEKIGAKHIGAVFGRARTPDTDWATISWREEYIEDSGVQYPIPHPQPPAILPAF